MLKMTLHEGKSDFFGNAFIPLDTYEIADGAFMGNRDITAVIIPSHTARIGERAFADCPNLRHVAFLGKTEYIGDYAFSGCPSLTSLSFPSSARYIGPHVVDGTPLTAPIYCAGQAAVMKYPTCFTDSCYTMPRSVYTIAKNAFWGCLNLKELAISEGLEVIPSGSFFRCGIRTLTVPASVRKIERYAFRACVDLERVIFLSDDTEIEDGAFSNGRRTELVFPTKKLRTDRYLQAIGDSFLRPVGIEPGDVPLGHLRSRSFKKLAPMAASGDADAMYALARFFDGRRERHSVYSHFANFWTYFAAQNGSSDADKFVSEWTEKNPEMCWSSPIREQLTGKLSGRVIRAMGLGFPARDCAEYTLSQTPFSDVRIISCQSESKEGRDSFDWWFVDKLLRPIKDVEPRFGLTDAEMYASLPEWEWLLNKSEKKFQGGGTK